MGLISLAASRSDTGTSAPQYSPKTDCLPEVVPLLDLLPDAVGPPAVGPPAVLS